MKKSISLLSFLVLVLQSLISLPLAEAATVGFCYPTASTIFADSSASSGGDGSSSSPYDDLNDVENRLSTDASITRVCFEGTFTGTLDTTPFQSTELKLTSTNSASPATISSLGGSRGVIYVYDSHYDGGYGDAFGDSNTEPEEGILESLTVSNLNLEGPSYLFDLITLSMNNVSIDANGEDYGLVYRALSSAELDGVSISNSVESALHLDSLGSIETLSISDSSFNDVGKYAISQGNLSAVEDLSVLNTNFSGYSEAAISLSSVDNLSIVGSQFNGQNSQEEGFELNHAFGVVNNFEFINNFVSNNSVGLDLSLVDKAEVYNNSFYNNDVAIGLGLDNKVKNNIFYSDAGQFAFGLWNELWWFIQLSDISLISEFNLYHGDGEIFYGDRGSDIVSTLSDWQADGFDAYSIEGDPLFVDAANGDLHIQTGSAAVNVAKRMSHFLSDDIDGELRPTPSGRGSRWDMGADEL